MEKFCIRFALLCCGRPCARSELHLVATIGLHTLLNGAKIVVDTEMQTKEKKILTENTGKSNCAIAYGITNKGVQIYTRAKRNNKSFCLLVTSHSPS